MMHAIYVSYCYHLHFPDVFAIVTNKINFYLHVTICNILLSQKMLKI